MPCYMYISLKDGEKILVFSMDAETGKLAPKGEVPVSGGPWALTISPDRKVLYVGNREVPKISSFRIDRDTGGLTQIGLVSPEAAPTYLSTDRKGRFLLSAYFHAGLTAVHPIREDGAVGGPPIEWLETATGAHAIQTDPSNRFAFVPHIAGKGPNVIYQFRFDENTGHLTPNSPPRVEPKEYLGPRHFCFHPTKNILYFSNEQGGSVTGYRLDNTTGSLSAIQTLTTLPEGYSEWNLCSQIQISPSGKFLYAANRGHNSVAAYSVDASSGRLTAIEQVSTEAVPTSFSLDPEGKFLFVAGSESGRLASYRVNGDTGELTPLETYCVGNNPMWVLMTSLGG